MCHGTLAMRTISIRVKVGVSILSGFQFPFAMCEVLVCDSPRAEGFLAVMPHRNGERFERQHLFQ